VAKKMKFLAKVARAKNLELRFHHLSSERIQFDETETFEHSKLKPLSIPLAVDKKTRRILGFKVAVMPAKGHLSQLSRKKYGKRPNERSRARSELLRDLGLSVNPFAQVESDQNPFYPNEIKAHFSVSIIRVRCLEPTSTDSLEKRGVRRKIEKGFPITSKFTWNIITLG
jgi:hypothetical protein